MIVLFGYSTWRPAAAIRQSLSSACRGKGTERGNRRLRHKPASDPLRPRAGLAHGIRVKFFVLDALARDFHRTMMFCAAPCSYIILVKRTQSPC